MLVEHLVFSRLGEHTDEMLAGLGPTEAQLAGLRALGVIR